MNEQPSTVVYRTMWAEELNKCFVKAVRGPVDPRLDVTNRWACHDSRVREAASVGKQSAARPYAMTVKLQWQRSRLGKFTLSPT